MLMHSPCIPVLVPVRASPVPSVVRGSFVVNSFFTLAAEQGSGSYPDRGSVHTGWPLLQ